MSSVGWVVDLSEPMLAAAVARLRAHLGDCGFSVTDDIRAVDAVVVWSDRNFPLSRVEELVAGSGPARPLLLAGTSVAAHAECAPVLDAAGVVASDVLPVHPLRLRPGADAGQVTARLDGDVLLTDGWLRLDKVVDDVEVLLTAMSGLTSHAVMTWRPSTGIGLFGIGSTPETVTDPAYQRLVHRWLRHALAIRDLTEVRVGLLGYGAIGHEHNAAIAAVEGLRLTAVCDRDPSRITAARTLAGEVTAYADGEALLAADDVDLVIVSTPPNTHADWALRALEAGKHVVVEKPFCLTTAEADEMIAAASSAGRRLAVYQNRRWDPDYLALKQVIRGGAIGEVFHYESFVGSYGHPCNYWHSDEEVSGGAIYDWGSHYLDWVLDLMPQPVQHVTAAAHKRVWHDVSNADHSRVTVRFVDGVEAEFIHSDLAAAMKPKWFVLGTRGAVVGDWRHERVINRSAIGTLVEDPLAASESPAALSVHAADGSVTALALPPAPRQPFHRELADLLLSGAPMSVTPAGSRRNIAVMEAAAVSAREAGRPVTPT
ncbi:MAG TPA: Gfo/Idh/MocA family oxidoreductase [Mycobacteriales bacterium]|nr:Gfo/Idh/MocA family oxidoreductase [Mycobacteriales bacterium]